MALTRHCARTVSYTVTLIATASMVPTAAWAQQSAAAGGNDESVALEEVVITAEKRPASLQNTPLSVVAVTGATLEAAQIKDVVALQNFVPNLSIGGTIPNGSLVPQFSIRGVGQSSGNIQSEKGVALYVDDIYYPRANGSILRLLDVERVEVLRGPQGTLFGRNATGGAIRYISRKPEIGKLEGSVEVTAGDFNRKDFSALLNVPIGDKVAVRLQGATWNSDGYATVVPNGVGAGNNSGEVGERRGGDKDRAFRAAIRIRPIDALTIDLTETHTEAFRLQSPITVLGLNAYQFNPFTYPIRIDAYNGYLTSIGQPIITRKLPFPPPPPTRESDDPRFLSHGFYSIPDNCILNKLDASFLGTPGYASNADASTRGDLCKLGSTDTADFLSADINWRASDHVAFRSITGYTSDESDFRNSQDSFGITVQQTFDKQPSMSQELQVLTHFNRLNWVAGTNYFREVPRSQYYERTAVGNNYNVTDNGLPTGNPVNSTSAVCCYGFDRLSRIKSESFGFYTEANYDVTKSFGVTVGLRYSKDEKQLWITRVDPVLPAFGLPASAGSIQTRFRTTSDSWDSTDYRVTLNYHFTDDVMVYATRATGYKAGGISADILGPQSALYAQSVNGLLPYKPEHNASNEIGLRSEWFDHQLRFNLTGYRMDYKDMIINSPDFSDPAGVTINELNAGDVRLSGVESEIVVAPVRGLTLSGSVGTISIDYLRLNAGSPLFMNYPGVGQQQTCPNAVRPYTFAQGCKAQDLQRTPHLSYTLEAQYQMRVGAEGSITGTAMDSYVSSQQTANNSLNSLRLPAYSLLNLRLQYDRNEWSIAAAASNVLGKEYYTGGSNGRLTDFQVIWAEPGPPRMWTVDAKYRF